ncbi:carbohydrate kinase family protein [Flavobacterium hercynium]|uniref:Carbohydrate kinase n=1 Tax=Flavobacterium hercynium TaxID=387094 RepID=A0A226H950_9FLAO|nr:carbohydrate kinase [Flavobacterium hercynium]OXA90368.1 carbohydrate kinase [Flavobacterium hercynium]SMP25847.1 fructokinase [Flavobacterium hercynium]
MKNQPTTPSIFCYGEVLWDIFPEGARAGGAPFNVAYNLTRMGIDAHMISRVGNDKLGNDLMAQLTDWNIPTEDSQTDLVYPTGTVIAHIDEHNEAHYDIIQPVAWDFIEFRDDYTQKVSDAAAFVFGSLITRNATSRNTLFELLEIAKYKVFDVNIRPPFSSSEVIKELLYKSDLVKMNKAELRLILDFLNKEYTTEDDGIRFVQDTFSIKEILVSKGSKGAVYYNENARFEAPAVPVTIQDTVGSGDSFLAGFLSKRILNADPEEIMNQATALGAFITSKEGACPNYTIEDFENFRKKNDPTWKTI